MSRTDRQSAKSLDPAVRLLAVVLAAAVVGVYANSLDGAFVIDDRAAIEHNETIRDLGRIGDVLASCPDSPVAGRPLANLTFAFNYAIGGLDVRGYHVVNVLLHLAAALLVFGIVRRTLESDGIDEEIASRAAPLAFAIALVWAVHPLGTEVVGYLSQRTEGLAGALVLATLYASIRAAGAPSPGRWQAVAIVACTLGVASKEIAALAPVLVGLYDRVYLYDSWRSAWRRRKRLYLGLGATWLLLAALMANGPRSASVGFSLGVSPWTYLLNQARMLVRYLRLTFWPDSLVAFYGWPRPLGVEDVLPEALAILALLGLTAWALVRVPRLGYPGAWFFLLLAPTSSILPITTEVGAERRMYLPLVAVVALVVLVVYLAVRRVIARLGSGGEARDRLAAAVQVALLLVVCGGLATATIARNREYSSELILARTMVERWPTGIAHHILGLELLEAGEPEEALEHLREAVARGNSRAGYRLGMALYEAGDLEAARERLEAFVDTARPGRRLEPRWLEPPPSELLPARVALARIHMEHGEWAKAEKEAGLALSVDPSRPDAQILLADALFAQQRWKEARGAYREALQADPDNAQALINLGIAEVGLGKPADAREAFERAVAADPESAETRQYLAMILYQLGDVTAAAREARQALALGADDPMLGELAVLDPDRAKDRSDYGRASPEGR